MDIHAAIEEFLGTKQNSITHSTYVWYARFLGYFDGWAREHRLNDLTQITPIHVQQFVSAYPTTNTNTRHARALIYKGVLSWCSQDEEMGVKERTVKRIEMPKLIQSEVTLFTDGEIMRLFRSAVSVVDHMRQKR